MLIPKDDMPIDDNFENRISSYSLKELLDVESSLDKERFPNKYARVSDEIARRKAAGEYVHQAYVCPICKKTTISHCDKQNSRGTIECSECGSKLYLDPNRSAITAWLGLISLVLAGVCETLWYVLAALVIVTLLRGRWVTFVSKDVYAFRSRAVEFVSFVVFDLISLLLTLLFIFSEPSYVGSYRSALIASCAISTIVLLGFSAHSYKKLRSLKN